MFHQIRKLVPSEKELYKKDLIDFIYFLKDFAKENFHPIFFTVTVIKLKALAFTNN